MNISEIADALKVPCIHCLMCGKKITDKSFISKAAYNIYYGCCSYNRFVINMPSPYQQCVIDDYKSIVYQYKTTYLTNTLVYPNKIKSHNGYIYYNKFLKLMNFQ